jgi:hypothetical protein
VTSQIRRAYNRYTSTQFLYFLAHQPAHSPTRKSITQAIYGPPARRLVRRQSMLLRVSPRLSGVSPFCQHGMVPGPGLYRRKSVHKSIRKTQENINIIVANTTVPVVIPIKNIGKNMATYSGIKNKYLFMLLSLKNQQRRVLVYGHSYCPKAQMPTNVASAYPLLPFFLSPRYFPEVVKASRR